MEEIWKAVEDYEGIYEVSNLGRVRSLDQLVSYTSRWGTVAYRPTKGKVLTQRRMRNGYMGVLFKVQGHTEMKLVHRLVAAAFVPNPQNLETVNHKDEDKQNNRADNLEWMSRADNVRYGTGSQRKRTPMRKVEQLTTDWQHVAYFDSIKEASEATGVQTRHIGGCCRNEYGAKTAGGYRWRYIE